MGKQTSLNKLFLFLGFVFFLLFLYLLFFSRGFIRYGSVDAYQLSLFFTALFFIYDEGFVKRLREEVFSPATYIHTFGLLFLLFFLIVVSRLFLYFVLRIPLDSANIANTLYKYPLLFLVPAVLLAPFAEELFFRVLLTPTIGVLCSAIIFTALHTAYHSLYELDAVFIAGFVFAAYYLKTRRMVPLFLTHFIVDGFTMLVLFHSRLL